MTHGILSRRKADDSGSGVPNFGEVRIDATYRKLPMKAKTNNDIDSPCRMDVLMNVRHTKDRALTSTDFLTYYWYGRQHMERASQSE